MNTVRVGEDSDLLGHIQGSIPCSLKSWDWLIYLFGAGHNVLTEVHGQFSEVGSLLPPHGFRG